MRYLLPLFWRKFLKQIPGSGDVPDDGAPFDGQAFEKLALSVLSCLYDHEWKGTPQTHDHSRDFYAKVAGGQVWAECKMYKKNISIHILSPTLVMALLDGIQQLVIISYSPLNKNALNHLAQYAAIVKSRIDVIDDEALEAIILANWTGFREYFPEDCQPPDRIGALPCVPSQIVVLEPHLVQLADDGDRQDLVSGEVLLRREQTFAIDLCIRNPDPAQVRAGHIMVECGPDSAFLLLNTSDETGNETGGFRFPVAILPRAVHHRRLFFKVRDYQRSIRLPKITVTMDGQPDVELERMSVGISSLPLVSLTGVQPLRILQRMREQARRAGGIRTLTLAGRSGTGKSRLLKEFGDVFAELDHHVTTMDVEARDRIAFDDFARLLLSQAYRLPLLSPERRLRGDGQARRIAGTHMAQVEAILYDEPGPLRTRLEECAKLLVTAIAERRVAVMVDNVQFLDEDGCRFLGRLLDLIAKAQGACHLIFCFNTDLLIAGSTAASLYNRLRGLADGDRHQLHELADFSAQDALAFLNASLSSARTDPDLTFSQRHEQVARDMLARCAMRPFFLEQFLLYLEDRKVLRRRAGRLVPRDIALYQTVKDEIRPKVASLIELRWDHLVRNKLKGCRKAVEILALFFNLPETLALQMGITQSAIRHLTDAGIAERTADGLLSFYHRELFVYFRQRFHLPAKAVAAKIVAILEAQRRTRAFFVPYVLAREATDGIDDALLGTAARILGEEGLHGERQADALQRIVAALLERGATLNASTALALLGSAPFRLSLLAPEAVSRPVIDRVHDHLWEAAARYRAFGEAYGNCVCRVVNLYFGLNRYSTSARLLQRTIDQFGALGFDDQRQGRLLLARLLNRMAVVHTHLRDLERALDSARQALAIAEQERDALLTIECEIDLGNIHDQLMPDRVDDILAHWQRAVTVLDEQPALAGGTYPSAMVRLYQAQAMLLRREVAAARTLLGTTVAACQGDLNNFFGIKCLVLLVLSRFLEGEELDAEQARRELERAIDWCMTTGVAHATWTIHLLDAKLAVRTGRREDAHRDYLLALRTYLDTEPTASMQENRIEFFEEIFLSVRHLAPVPAGMIDPDRDGEEDGGPAALFARITSPTIQALHQVIEQCTEAEFDKLWRSYRAKTTFTDGKFMLPNC